MISNILIISPHMDDETIGCGGLIHKVISSGGKVTIVQFAKYRSNGDSRLEEYNNAVYVLGKGKVNSILLELGYDGSLDLVNKSNYVAKLDSIIQDIRPTAVLYPLPSHHQDHILINKVSISALRPLVSTNFIKLKAAYEYPPNFYYGFNSNPIFYLELSDDDIKAKQEALLCYKSQLIRDSRDQLDISSIIEIAGIRGKAVCKKYAEAYFPLQVSI